MSSRMRRALRQGEISERLAVRSRPPARNQSRASIVPQEWPEHVQPRIAEGLDDRLQLAHEALDPPERAVARAVGVPGAELVVEDHRPLGAQRRQRFSR